MGLFDKFRTTESGSDRSPADAPMRRRTFSATQYRDEELQRSIAASQAARAAEQAARTAPVRLSPMDGPDESGEAPAWPDEDEAEALDEAFDETSEETPAAWDEPPAETVAASAAFPEVDSAIEEEAAPDVAWPVSAIVPPALAASEPATAAGPPMDWDEAAGWLSSRSANARAYVAQQWNWEHDLRVLHFLVGQPDMDAGVAAALLWLTGATEDFFPWSDERETDDEQFRRAQQMIDQIGRRFADGNFEPARFGFDDSWDCGALKDRLETLFNEGLIDWSPEAIPAVSPGPVMTFDDVPAEEQAEIRDFLARFGTC